MTKIIPGFPSPQKDHYKVYVNTITYNQAPYIEDNLNGVAMQQTNFPFVHQVLDDASTDGEQDVIKAWMERECDMEHAEYYDNDVCTIILVKAKNNPNYTLAAYLLKKNLWKEPQKKETLVTPWREVCPYEALCEGDDYWIDAKKLQKQVEYMDGHPDYSMCYSAISTIDSAGKQIIRPKYERAMKMSRSGDILKDLLVTNFVMTCTTMLRKDVFDSELYRSLKYTYDYPTFLTASILGKCKYFPESMAAYRQNPNGAMATQSDKITMMFQETKIFFYKGLTDGSIEIDRKRLSPDVLKLIVSYCLYNEDEGYKERYREILKNKALRSYMPWAYIKHFIAKKILRK